MDLNDLARGADELCDWWEEHRGLRGFAWGCMVTVWISFLLWPLPQPEVQGPPMPPAAQPMPTFDKITTTVCRQETVGNVCIVRETFERKPTP
jgi:hypothetical protein